MRILLEEYQTSWLDDFLTESSTIRLALADCDPVIEHIGSTSIPGLCAKPTIDILVGLADEGLLDESISPMIGSGYTYFRKYQPAMPYRRLFARLIALTDRVPPHVIDIHDEFVRGQEYISAANIHIVVKDTPHWHRHLAFRDFLRTHAELRDEYGRLKKALSTREFMDTNAYNAAKDSLIKEIQGRALAWYASQKTVDTNG